MLSSVELNERIRSLKMPQRLGYSTAVALVVVLAFWLAIILSVVIALLLVLILAGGPLTMPEDAIALSLPLTVVFMLTVGMSGLGAQHTLVPGQHVLVSARKSARSGFIVGVIAGAIFGFLWGLLIQANPLIFAAVIGLSLAPALASFRAIAHVVEPVCLRLVAGRRANSSK
jgi:hypothetical protein